MEIETISKLYYKVTREPYGKETSTVGPIFHAEGHSKDGYYESSGVIPVKHVSKNDRPKLKVGTEFIKHTYLETNVMGRTRRVEEYVFSE